MTRVFSLLRVRAYVRRVPCRAVPSLLLHLTQAIMKQAARMSTEVAGPMTMPSEIGLNLLAVRTAAKQPLLNRTFWGLALTPATPLSRVRAATPTLLV